MSPRERFEQRTKFEQMLDQPWMREPWFAKEFKKVIPLLEEERTLAGLPAIERNLSIVKSVRESIPLEELGDEHKEAIIAALYYGVPKKKIRFVPRPVRPIVEQLSNIRAAVLAGAGTAEIYHKIAEADNRAALIEILALAHAKLRKIPDEQKRRRLAEVAADAYAPLAQAMGLRRYKEMLEESAFQVLHYDEWRSIHEAVKKYDYSFNKSVAEAKKVAEEAMQQLGLVGHVEWRRKQEHSIAQKMQSSKYEDVKKIIEQIGPSAFHDLGAMRVVIHGRPVNSRDPSSLRPATHEDCYALSQAITAHERVRNLVLYKDYIAKPKPLVVNINGREVVTGEYRSWHGDLYLKKAGTMPLELQIRTKKMHEEAETGGAAAWLYKGHVLPKTVIERFNALARQLHAAPLKQKQPLIQVRLPGGVVAEFPTHATVADAVFRIQGNSFGNYPFTAFINGKRARPLQQLEDGAEVTVKIDPNGAVPHYKWLDSLLPETAAHVFKFLKKLKQNP